MITIEEDILKQMANPALLADWRRWTATFAG